jgi:hypothetical protein
MPCEHRDFYKFNKELLDDDFNPGKTSVVKGKVPSNEGGVVHSWFAKFANPDEHGVSAIDWEYKVDINFWGNGMVGKLGSKGLYQFTVTRDVSEATGCKGLDAKLDYSFDHNKPGNPLVKFVNLGMSYNFNKLYCRHWIDLTKRWFVQGEYNYECCDRLRVG